MWSEAAAEGDTVIALVFLVGGGLAVLSVVLSARWIEWWLWQRQLAAYRLELPRSLSREQVSAWLAALGAATRHIPALVEIAADRNGIRHYLVAPERHLRLLLNQARTLLPGIRLVPAAGYLSDQAQIRAAGELRVTSTSHPLAQDRAAGVSSALLAALQPLAPGQHIRISWLLAGMVTPHPAGLVGLAPDLVRFRRLKQRSPLVRACGRITISGAPPQIARALLYRVYSTMRVLDAPGAALVRRMVPWRIVAARMRDHSIPLTIWPAVLNTSELAGLLAMPFDGSTTPGVALNTARQIPPAPELPRRGLLLAHSNYPDMTNRPLALRQADRLRHLWLLGPTGTGKSTLIANMALQDAAAGYGLVVVDPKSDLCDDILARMPEERIADVVVLNPAATAQPIGFNILQAARDEQARELVVDTVVHIFAEIWKSAFGARTTDVVRNALLTLTAARSPDGSAFTLAEVAPLLEQPAFRRFVTAQPSVPASVRSFWQAYEALSPRERAQAIAPSLNKLRALTTSTALRLSLGQSRGIDVAEVFTRRRILLVSLNKGLVGPEAAPLLGSLFVSMLLNAAMQRAAIPAAKRRPAWAYLDEFQDVLRVGGDVADALSQARALGLGFVLAHQYLGQLPPAMQTAVISTVRSSVAFQLDRDDAKTLEQRFLPSLSAEDLMGLRAHEAVLRLCVDGQTRTPVTGHTRPLAEPIRDPLALAEASRRGFGTIRADVEAALQHRLHAAASTTKFGRRREGGA